MATIEYTPDILNCLANLSNDEVFTPPEVVNQMLDMLPADLWTNPDVRFLDPVSKTGVFLREIAKRLMSGLAQKIPDKQERVNHIFTTQLFGISITEMTSFLSRRTVYCSKKADGEYSVCTKFADNQGNIVYERLSHTWEGGRCKYCGASQSVYERGDNRETYAYQFIHTDKPEKIFNDMKFDVIIGNPPYQLSDGGDTDELQRGAAIPLYHLFIQQAKKLNPRFLIMIVPSRWFAGGRGLDNFRDEMLNDKRLRVIHDFYNASDCFPGVEIKGGVCYFLWNRDSEGLCSIVTHDKNNIVSKVERPLLENGADIFIRFNQAIPIFRKVVVNKNFKSFIDYVSSRKPFGFASTFKDYKRVKESNSDILIYANKSVGYLNKSYVIPQNEKWIDKYKVYISFGYGAGEGYPHQIINKPFLGMPNSCCTETYLFIGPFDSKIIAENVISYVCTKFFRFMVMLRKNTQNGTRGVYQFVPIQDFNEPWTDEKLYKKYGLTEDEIAFIESMIRPMEG